MLPEFAEEWCSQSYGPDLNAKISGTPNIENNFTNSAVILTAVWSGSGIAVAHFVK